MPRKSKKINGREKSNAASRRFTCHWDIPGKRIKFIPNARPRRARNTGTTPRNKRRKKAPAPPIPCKSSIGRLFPELTEHASNYYEIQNRQITHIPFAQPQLQETKRLNDTNAHTFPGRTHAPELPDNTGQENKHTENQRIYLLNLLRNPSSTTSRA